MTNMLNETHRLATEDDVPRLYQLLNTQPTSVWVRDFFYGGEPFPIESVAAGPYELGPEGKHLTIFGFDRKSGIPAKLRIVGITIEIMNERFTEWTAPSMKQVGILIPKS